MDIPGTRLDKQLKQCVITYVINTPSLCLFLVFASTVSDFFHFCATKQQTHIWSEQSLVETKVAFERLFYHLKDFLCHRAGFILMEIYEICSNKL